MAKRRRDPRRHRLLIYYRLGQRLRVAPLLIAAFSAALYAIGWLYERGAFEVGNPMLLRALWANRVLILALIGYSLLLYVLSVLIARVSFVEARRKALRVRAGLVPIDISYGRIRQIRLARFSNLYPPEALKRRERARLRSFADMTCTVIDLQSWPRLPLRRLWDRLMFTRDGASLLFIVEQPMLLNQQIDAAMTQRHARLTQEQRVYKDPIDRAMQAHLRRKR